MAREQQADAANLARVPDVQPVSVAALTPLTALQANAGNATFGRFARGDAPITQRPSTIARQPRRCACGGVIGADGECARCKARRLAGEAVPSREDRRARAGDAIRRQLIENRTETSPARPRVARQATVPAPGPGGPSCQDLLQQIIELLNEVAQRFNDALNDRHGLYEHHRRIADAHPEHGSWEGHERRYNQDRGDLRRKLAEWDADDDCRGFRLSPEQQTDMEEAREFGDKAFPERPAPAMRSGESEESAREGLRRFLPDSLVETVLVIGGIVVAAGIIACFATGVCEVAAVLGGLGYATAAAIAFILSRAGVRDTSDGPPIAAAGSPADEPTASAAA